MHALVWAVAIGITILLGYDGYSGFYIFKSVYYGINALLAVTWMLVIFYAFYSIIFPKYFRPKKYAAFSLVSLIIIGILPVLFWLTFGLVKVLCNKGNAFSYFTADAYFGGVIGSIFIGGLGSAYRMVIDWFSFAKEKDELENQNLNSQLQLLKYKINPHFLFNTLNNIDSLITDDAEKASYSLNKLSEMMRYMIYESERNAVPLKDEVNYIENYIHLQKIRNSYPDNITFRVSGDIQPVEIAPMLFLPFIENAFKHSALNNKYNKVDISLNVGSNSLHFICSNTMQEKSIEKDKTSGIGLDIIKKRLELIYPNIHTLNVEQTENEYKVSLVLKIV